MLEHTGNNAKYRYASYKGRGQCFVQFHTTLVVFVQCNYCQLVLGLVEFVVEICQQETFLVAHVAVTYSASAVNWTTHCCRLDAHVIGDPR